MSPFLDLPPLTAARFAAIEDRVAALLRTGADVIVTQGEALLPLEAAIRGAVRPGSTALNVVTGPYGQTFGGWLRDCGAEVVDLAVPYDTAVTAGQVADALAAHPEISFVSLVHAEAATGNTNPVAEIGGAVRAHGALLMLDAVASVAAEPLDTDAWGVDLCVIGGQKAMGGPAGVSAVSVSARAWRAITDNPRAPAAPTSRCSTGRSAGRTPDAPRSPTHRPSWRCSRSTPASTGSPPRHCPRPSPGTAPPPRPPGPASAASARSRRT